MCKQTIPAALAAALTLAALADFSRAIAPDPDNKNAWRERGRAYSQRGNFDRAIADYNEAIRLDPEYAWAYNNRGVAYSQKGDYRRARADWEQALRLDPGGGGANARRNLEWLREQGH
ncbi:MAG: tetratricopeptide repeat protein [Treponema sp.]|jgi:Flp pilus assembly protein TadD|nr:tetratricopeptide repeat protein [Treponema sp.]